MQSLKRIALLPLLAFAYLCTAAQTNNCSADFTYSVGYNNSVTFIAVDSLGATHRWSFGDGTGAQVTSHGVIIHNYLQPGQYTVSHVIEKPNSNCRDSVIKIITVELRDDCKASFGYSKTPGTLSYQFFNHSTTYTGIKKLLWQFGDGGISDAANPTHTFAPGTYNVCLRIETNNGCTSEYCQQFKVIDSSNVCTITAKYTYKKDSLDCKKVYFINTSSPVSPNVHFAWKFGDGGTSNDINPSHVYNQPGKYYVCLVSEVVNDSCRATYCDSVIVNCDTIVPCNIIAKYSYVKDSFDCKKIRFINLSTVATSGAHFIWKFGDGTTSNDVAPSHVYGQPGKYYACLVIEAGTNCRKEYCDSVIVKCDTIIPCNITAKYSYVKDSLDCKKIRFINLSTVGTSGAHYIWKFGDGTTSNDISPTHVYSQSGKYYTCLVIEAGTNCRKEYCDSVIVKCDTVIPCNITAKYSYRKDSIDCRKIYFINASTVVSPNVHFIWKFGDGGTSNDINPTHVYNQPGKYYVCLVIEAGANCRREYCDSVIVKCDVPVNCDGKAKFTYTILSSAPPSITLQAQYLSNTASYAWSFGDSAFGNGPTQMHRYQHSGRYRICLTVTDGQCKVTNCQEIQVGFNCDSVKVKYEYTRKPNRPNEISFTAVSNEPLVVQTWYIYKGSNTPAVVLQQSNPTYTFSDTGWYQVCLKGVSASMCAKQYCQTIHIEKVVNSGLSQVTASPNPAVSTVTLDVSLTRPEQVMLKIMDASGTVTRVFSKSGVTGNNRFTLPVDGLNKGIYLVEIRTSTGRWFSRFQKG